MDGWYCWRVECRCSCKSPLRKFVRRAGVVCGSGLSDTGCIETGGRLGRVRRHTVPVRGVERRSVAVVTIGRRSDAVICARVRRKEGRGTGESDLRRRRCAVVDLAGEDVRQALFCSLSAQIKPGPFAAAPALFPFNCPCLPLILKQLYWALCFYWKCPDGSELLYMSLWNVVVTSSISPNQ